MLSFRKFHATGNDFLVLQDNPKALSEIVRHRLCNRHVGIGADGIIHVEFPNSPSEEPVVLFHYWNADGKEGSFCGNGARVAAWLGHELRGFREVTLRAVDGIHKGKILSTSPPWVSVSLSIREEPMQVEEGRWFIDSGSPHLLLEVPLEEFHDFPLSEVAPPLRFCTEYDAGGMNVSIFTAINKKDWKLRTYERGVEAETLSCGTACVALAALVGEDEIRVHTAGGVLTVHRSRGEFWLTGSLEELFRGEWIASF
ncbi:MAG: diaminopimelate epimerase [Bacteroidia bacterium]|nr:diaminopimelate epimerase [Bacteroidia bacterium]MDW8134635.1 diaminopimelate epimerase [Bacteroidia bacterium]